MNKRLHNIRLTIRRSIDEMLGKSLTDKNYPHKADDSLRAELYTAWESGLFSAAHDIGKIIHRYGAPKRSDIHEILSIFEEHLSGNALLKYLDSATPIASAFSSAKNEVDREYKKQTGRDPKAKKSGFAIGIIFGLTESHALDALDKITRLSAGGFWNDEITDIVRRELETYFDGELTREALGGKLKKFINDRLSVEGEKSLPRSYFDGLSEHMIVRTRSIGKVYRGKALGANGYRIRNPRDHRTSSICNGIAAAGVIYGMKAAESVVKNILTAGSLQELKDRVPFFTSATSPQTPVPPLHWRCRSWIEMVFAGLNDGEDSAALDFRNPRSSLESISTDEPPVTIRIKN